MKHMALEAVATKAWCSDGWICIRLDDGRELRFPAASNRRLKSGTPEQVANIEMICEGTGLHWPDLDEDLSVQGILEGRWGQ